MLHGGRHKLVVAAIYSQRLHLRRDRQQRFPLRDPYGLLRDRLPALLSKNQGQKLLDKTEMNFVELFWLLFVSWFFIYILEIFGGNLLDLFYGL